MEKIDNFLKGKWLGEYIKNGQKLANSQKLVLRCLLSNSSKICRCKTITYNFENVFPTMIVG
jgi:hypothetical protein